MRATLSIINFAVPLLAFAAITVQESNTGGIIFRYEPGPAEVHKTPLGNRIDFPDADHLAQAGEYDLPIKVVRVGVPQQGRVFLETRAGPEEVLDGVAVATVPLFSWEKDSWWTEEPVQHEGYLPRTVVELGPVEQFRSVRFVTLRLSPVQFDPVRKRLRWFRWIDVQIRFEHKPERRESPDPMDAVTAKMLLNGREAKDWKLESPAPAANPYAQSPVWLKITIDSTGIYGITGSELARAGVPLAGLDPRTLALFTVGEHVPGKSYPDTMTPVPILVQGEDDGRLDPDDRLIFYGLASEHWLGRCSVWVKNYFTAENVYWLTWGAKAGQRIAHGLGPDTTGARTIRTGRWVKHLERDLDCPARSGLLWVWARLFKPEGQPPLLYDVNLSLESPIRVHRFSGQLFAETGGNELTLRFNGRPVKSLSFEQAPPSAPLSFTVDTTLPADARQNMLTFEVLRNGNKGIIFDYLDVEFTRWLVLENGRLSFLADDTGKVRFVVRRVAAEPVILDVTQPYRPRMIEGFEWRSETLLFCVRLARPAEFAIAGRDRLLKPKRMELRTPGRLLEPTRTAHHWIIAPGEFAGPAQMLARFRTGRIPGIVHSRSAFAALEEIYDDYCFGLAEPWAIKRFLADKRPAYALLVGDATYDYKDNLRLNRSRGTPAYETGFGLNPDGTQDRSALALDVWFADFEGEGASPDVMLGRVTARDPVEFRRFVDKAIGYETGPAGFWSKRFLLLADDEFNGDPWNPNKRDPIGFGHMEYCDNMATLAGQLLEPVKLYSSEYPYVGVKRKPLVNAELLRQINLGALLWVFFGHGSGFDLTHESVLNITGIPQIANGRRLPFCYFGSCSVGRFDDTQFECIAEELVRKSDGAIATIGATKSTAASSNQVFCRNLLIPLFLPSDTQKTIGSCFIQAWPTDRSYHLFGDPATVLRLPRVSSQQLCLSPDTLRPGRLFRCQGLLDVPSAEFAWTLFGPRRLRYYSSWCGVRTFELPGLELARGTGRIRDGRFFSEAIYPLGLPSDTVPAFSGYYVPIPGTCRFSVSAWNDSIDLSLLADMIPCGTLAPANPDHEPPAVHFWADGRRLTDSCQVPAEFLLEGVVTDPSGILIAPIGGAAPEFYVNDRKAAIDLTDRLVMDESSYTTARFRLPVSLKGPWDSLFVIVSDNLLNRTVAKLLVRSLPNDLLAVDSLLVYPNPVIRDAVFSFTLNRTATVRVRIWTLGGRLVRDLGLHHCKNGYNQLSWDGLDRNGGRLANGVYLWTLRAAATDNHGRPQTVTKRERLLISR
ncbi:MAG: C25 family cysteine peptidase [candidate division WOR-3 bacterium]